MNQQIIISALFHIMSSCGRRRDDKISRLLLKLVLLTGGVKHDERRWMFLQEAVERLVGQVEDRGACL